MNNLKIAEHISNAVALYKSQQCINLPIKVKKFLIGSEVQWEDSTPLSQNFDEKLAFFFHVKTTPITDVLLRRNGLRDASDLAYIPLHWGIEMVLIYDKPNRGQEHKEPHYFEFFGMMFPAHEKFTKQRDQFFLLKNMEFMAVDPSHKNKKVYRVTRFVARVIGV